MTASVLWGSGQRASALPLLVGDVNCSGTVDSIDAALTLQYSAALVTTLPCILNAHVDLNAQVTSVDAALILQYSAGLVDRLPPVTSFVGTITTVHGLEANCIALDTGSARWVLWEPAGLTPGQHVRVTGYIDLSASFCGITPLLHNISVEPAGLAASSR